MNNIQILDCTLRDGGYCNNWEFGFRNIKRIVDGLIDTNIEIIECGFLSNRVFNNLNSTRFSTIKAISSFIPYERKDRLFVVMVNYGEYELDDIPQNDGRSVDGFRVAFHKKDMEQALEFCEKIQEKGYYVFIQAMVSISYSDEEFLSLIKRVNGFRPYAFYIVDSFGMMKGKDLTRLFYMVEHNLDSSIWIGFHCHNNMQLAFSNAQQLTMVQTNRNLIIDSTIYGMGRGAGNLNTELFIDYLNENFDKNYKLKPLLTIIDEILNEFYQRNYWGYSLPNYISATHRTHPNYARYLDDKKTLTIEDMNEILELMDDEKKVSFDKDYIDDLYLNYMEKGRIIDDRIARFKNEIAGKAVLLIAPGKSAFDEKDRIKEFFEKNDVVIISINHVYSECVPDYVFISNLRRYRDIDEEYLGKSIVTSNISYNGAYIKVQYKELLNSEEAVSDNAGLMAIKFLINNEVEKVFLAGFDGYSHDVDENYCDSRMAIMSRNVILDAMNAGMTRVLNDYSRQISINFLTTPKHLVLS